MKLTISIFLFLGLQWLVLVRAGYPRLYFAGNFLADTATLNNDPYNWNISAFNASRDPPCYPNYTFPHCDWNPTGGSDFRFVNCYVTKVCYMGGKCSQNDSVVGKRIIGSDDNVAGKMTDLDPFYQMYTAQLWGLIVGVEGAFQGKFKTNTVMDVWQRCKEDNCSGDPGTSGYWSSVLTDVTWTGADTYTGSMFINELRYSQQDSSNGILNIKFTVDLMHEDPRRPDFALGRVVGTISAVDGRLGHLPEFNRMMWWQGPQWLSPDVPREPEENSTYWNAPFYVDDVNKKVVVDLSNSLPTDKEGNLRDDLIGNIYLVVLQQLLSLPMVEGRIMDCSTLLAPCCTNLGRIPYTNPGFLVKNSGIATFCLRPLALKYPLMIVREETVACPDSEDCPKQCTPILVERLNGLYVGPAEDRVFRIPQPKMENPPSKPQGEDGKVCWSSIVFATQFGKPKAGVGLSLHHYDRHGLNTGEPADVINVLPFDCSGYAKPTTNAYGIGAFGFQTDEGGLDCSRRPPNRAHLAGQLYIYNITLSGDISFPPNLLTSTHLYCKINKKDNYTWDEDIYSILKLYENLYPVMKPLFNLSSQEDVKKHFHSLHYAMSLPIENPNHMPVTRDLSPAKRHMILEWLKPTPDTAPELHQLEVIKQNLHTALMLEWATIPPYLSAYYSIKEGYNKEIAMLLKTIIIEEMSHMSMVANILNFLGEAPIFTNPTQWPKYPGKLPGGVMPNLTVGLARFSKQVTHDVFMSIETPECNNDLLEVHRLLWQIASRILPTEIPQQCQNKRSINNAFCDPISVNLMLKCNESNYNMSTIGALYIHRILCPMVKLNNSHPEVFAPKNENLDKQVPIPFCVLNICSAIEGIRYILGEGEGGDPCNPCFEEELSHYYKFKEIWKGRQLVDGEGKTCKNSFQSCTTESCDNNTDDQSSDTDPFTPCNDIHCSKNYTFTGPIIPFNEEGVWPTLENPSTLHYPPGSRARILSDSFNLKYTNLMTCLHETFNGNPGQFSQCYALMTSLTVDAKRLVQTNLTATDNVYGAPTFEWYSRDGNN
ncbi:uncharacterized protein LOC144922078 [Branchiostoma floridae x Branchiostoma belcheri]